MRGRMMLVAPAILAMLVAALALSVRSSWAERAADTCIVKPSGTAPQGSHWYYRMDRVANRRCWYLGPEGMKKVREAAAPRRPNRGSTLRAPASSARPDRSLP